VATVQWFRVFARRGKRVREVRSWTTVRLRGVAGIVERACARERRGLRRIVRPVGVVAIPISSVLSFIGL
jgi:hypothetical protein